MKIVILTTNTPHHIFFVNKLSKNYKLNKIIVETSHIKPDFDTFHPFEKIRDEYENDILLNNQQIGFKDFASTEFYNSVNQKESVVEIKAISPDIIITFGTGIIKKDLINICPNGFINLHGGDPQFYRGLDSHLWAIYHKDFLQLVVTLHRLNSFLDDGEIIAKSKIELNKESNLFSLRAENTKICIDLVLMALNTFLKNNNFNSSPQRMKGRYYSFMPSALKEICLNNFNKYVSKL
tara:strand:+ start:195 stop:905 length:711 start_codon:yes stop_codon:yes gene_type:complete